MTDEILTRVEAACTQLAANGDPITLTAVAHHARIGRATLYRRPELRALVEHHRANDHDAHTLTGLAQQISDLRHTLDGLADTIHRHEQDLQDLKEPQHPQPRSTAPD